MARNNASQIESPPNSSSQTFTIRVDGRLVGVTRYGTDDGGRTHFELVGMAEQPEATVRDVFPTDRGYVKNGDVYAVTAETVTEDFKNWEWERVGTLESSLLRVSGR